MSSYQDTHRQEPQMEQAGSVVANKKPMTEEERLALAKKLDDELDDFINGLEKKRYTEGWSEDKWEEEMDKHPFFMKSMPEKGEMSPLVEGLSNLKFDPEENTPLELATNYKEDGNFYYKHKNYRMAIIAYTEGIKQKCDSNDLNATLYQNRAAAHMQLENLRSALLDSEKALKLTPGYYKAAFRAAKAALQSAKYAQCIQHCQTALTSKPEDKEVAVMLAKAKQRLAFQERNERKKKRLTISKLEQMEQIVRTIKERGIRIHDWVNKIKEDLDLETEYLLLDTTTSQPSANQTVYLEDGVLHWPMLLLYPEYKTTDFINGCPETSSLLTNFEQVFPAPWDEEGKYNLGSISVYYEGYNSKLFKVDPKKSLKELMVGEYFEVKGGSVCFIILAGGSDAEKRFLKENQ